MKFTTQFLQAVAVTISTLLLSNIVHAAVVGPALPTVSDGDPITSSAWNAIVDEINTYNQPNKIVRQHSDGSVQAATFCDENGLNCLATSGVVTNEADPEVGMTTTNNLGKWDGSKLVDSGVLVDGSGNVEAPSLNVSGGATSLQTLDKSDDTVGGRIGFESTGYTMFLGTTGLDDLNLQSNSTTRMTIDGPTGNVGIGGVPAANQKILVKGGRSAFVAQNEQYALALGRSDNAGNYAYLGISTDANPSIIFSSNGGAELVRVTNTGNVGIGTTSPMQALDVGGRIVSNSADPAIILRETDGTANQNWWMTSTAGQFQVKTVNDDLASGWVDRLAINQDGNVGIGTTNPQAKLHVMGKVDIHQSGGGGGQNRFTGIHTPTDANGRAQLVMSSAYSDLVIASSQANDSHGSSLSFAAYNPSNAADYRKFVVHQGGWGTRKHMLEFGYADAARTNPHGYINGTDVAMTIDGALKRVGIGARTPAGALDVGSSFYTGTGQVIVRSQNGASEGGEIKLLGAGTNDGVTFDNYGGDVRLYWSDVNNHNFAVANYGTGVTNMSVEGNVSVNGSLVMDGNTVIDNGGGWHRTYGNTGWYNGTHGGGWYMTDSTWIRAYNGKSVLTTGNMQATSFIYSSDERLKENISTIESPIETINSLRGVDFDWKKTGKKDVGFIAQEVEEVLPELVHTNEESGMKSVQYGNIVPVLVEAMKEQQKQIELLQKQVELLKNQ